jgi:hypothetical protein
VDGFVGRAVRPRRVRNLLSSANLGHPLHLSALHTAVTGLNDWSDTIGGETRVGAVHASANVTAFGLHIGFGRDTPETGH